MFNYFARNADNLLVAKFMGDTQLGYYDKAYKLALYPEQNLTHVITPVIHPILSEYQDDKAYIYENYMKIVKILSLLGLFVVRICILRHMRLSVLCSVSIGRRQFLALQCLVFRFGHRW